MKTHSFQYIFLLQAYEKHEIANQLLIADCHPRSCYYCNMLLAQVLKKTLLHDFRNNFYYWRVGVAY